LGTIRRKAVAPQRRADRRLLRWARHHGHHEGRWFQTPRPVCQGAFVMRGRGRRRPTGSG